MALATTRVILAIALGSAVVIGLSQLQRRGPPSAPATGAGATLRRKILAREFLAGFPPGRPGVPRCVLMDWNVGGGVATLVAFDDGTVSLYSSAGGGIIGAGAHENVKPSATAFREAATAVLARFTPTDTFPLPAGNANVIFYAVMDSVTLSSGEIEASITGLPADHPLAGLFGRAQALITEIRRVAR